MHACRMHIPNGLQQLASTATRTTSVRDDLRAAVSATLARWPTRRHGQRTGCSLRGFARPTAWASQHVASLHDRFTSHQPCSVCLRTGTVPRPACSYHVQVQYSTTTSSAVNSGDDVARQSYWLYYHSVNLRLRFYLQVGVL